MLASVAVNDGNHRHGLALLDPVRSRKMSDKVHGRDGQRVVRIDVRIRRRRTHADVHFVETVESMKSGGAAGRVHDAAVDGEGYADDQDRNQARTDAHSGVLAKDPSKQTERDAAGERDDDADKQAQSSGLSSRYKKSRYNRAQGSCVTNEGKRRSTKPVGNRKIN